MCFAINFFVKSVLPIHLGMFHLFLNNALQHLLHLLPEVVNQPQQHLPTRGRPMSGSPESQEHPDGVPTLPPLCDAPFDEASKSSDN
jgi:hypothetical protein